MGGGGKRQEKSSASIQMIQSGMRTIIAGFDSFDPGILLSVRESSRTPNLSKLLDAGGCSPLDVCSPPQTDVSWISIVAGMDAGSHGPCDSMHLDLSDIEPPLPVRAQGQKDIEERSKERGYL